MSGTEVCHCSRGYVRSLEEDDFGFPGKVEQLAATKVALLGHCRSCGVWWERLPHYVYGYAWYRTDQEFWDAADPRTAIEKWSASRQDPGI